MPDQIPLTDERLVQIEAHAAAALHCPNAAANGRLDGQHTLTGSFTTVRCELCDYSRPRGERAEETAALAAEVRRLHAELARRVQCNDCGAVGPIFTGDDGLAYLDPSGQIGHPAAVSAAGGGE
jgi:hypothetical protein